MKALSYTIATLGFVAMFFALFINLPVVSGDLEAGKWAFIATVFAFATFLRVESLE